MVCHYGLAIWSSMVFLSSRPPGNSELRGREPTSDGRGRLVFMRTTTRARTFRATPTLPPPSPSRELTITALLGESGRAIVPIRTTFIQQGHGKSTRPGPLATFLTSHDERGLDAYLLVHALASAEPWTCEFGSVLWVRTLGIETNKEASARGAVSKVMRRLEERKLVRRSRANRKAVVQLLREDGSGNDYTHPARTDRYLRLTDAYWREGYFTTLSMAAKVMLLVALERDDGFYLPFEYAPDWYGISADTAERGLRELHNHDILHEWVPNPRSDTGWAPRWTYTVTGSFSKDAQDAAARRRDRSPADNDGES